MVQVAYEKNEALNMWEPTRYPAKKYESMAVPQVISRDFNRLTSLIEDKYTKEFLKVCAFYNKLFASLKQYDWSRSSYNTVPFTLQDQERTDTGMGISSNYLKAAIDLVVSRIANIKYKFKLKTELPTVQYKMYKDDLERVFRAFVKTSGLNRLTLEAFHDAAILSFSHVFIDPWVGSARKVSDWELGCYESEFNEKKLVHVMIRDFAFPVTQLAPYLTGFDSVEELNLNTKQSVDLRLTIDCTQHMKFVTINNFTDKGTDYPFDEVFLATYSWDIGIRRTTVASLFDSLYPMQRQLNKLLAKKTQLLAMYKGPVPVFSGTDIDVVVKQLSNAAGEVLFLDTQRKAADLLTVLEPTPLDPNLNSEVESLKAQMFEIAGVQQISMDIEAYRSAATLMALNQMRDAGFQSQLSSMADFIQQIINMFITYQSKFNGGPIDGISWLNIHELLQEAYIEIIPVHDNDPTEQVEQEKSDDIMRKYVDMFIQDVAKGRKTFNPLDFTLEPNLLRQQAALRFLEYKMLNNDSEACFNLECLLVELFIQDVQQGYSSLKIELPSMQGGPSV